MHKFQNFIPAILWFGFILLLIGLPGNDFPRIGHFWLRLHPDKLVHIFLWSFLSMFLIAGFNYKGIKPALGNVYIGLSFAICMFYGGMTEILQAYVFAGRSGDIHDFLADCFGTLVGLFLFRLFYYKRFRPSAHK
ncbi:MAG TPA: VanZ family protein [Bacteroidales bacterium]|nr:VanZ family protein [Bacteroidales bacterium]